MSRPGGIVPAAAVDDIAATLAARFPALPDTEIRAHAHAIAADLGKAGWRVAARPARGESADAQ